MSAAAKVFISYSRKDAAFVDRLDAELRARGLEPLIDRSEIYAFEDWWARIEGLIAEADAVVFVLSPDALASDVCAREVAFAETLNKRLAPVVARAVDPAQVPPALARLNFVHLDDEASRATGYDKLAAGLTTDIGWVRRHSEYGSLAERWTTAGRSSDLLLRPPRLEEAEAWLAERPANAPSPTASTGAFVIASRRGETRRRRYRMIAMTIGLVLALGLAALAFWQRREAVAQRRIAERNFAIAKTTVDDVVFDLARGLRQVDGIRVTVLRSVLSRTEAAMGRLFVASPDDPALQRSRSVMLDEFGDTYLAADDLANAARAYEEGLALLRRLVARDPEHEGWRRDLSVSLARTGNLKLRQGDTAGAMQAYEESLRIVRDLLTRDPARHLWRRDLLIGLNKIGDVKLETADIKGALSAYEEALTLARTFAKRDPGEADAQRDLSVGLERVGDARMRSVDAAGALPLYAESLAIRRALAARDRDNALWQRDLSVSLDRMGDATSRAGDTQGALAHFEEGLALMRVLAGRDPGNVGWQRDLSISLERVGDARSRSGDDAGARTMHEAAHAIRRAFAQRDPENLLWQRDLSISLDKLAALKLRAGDGPGALALYEESLAIRRGLVDRHPGRADLEQELSISLNRVGDTKLGAGDRAGALKALQEDIALRRRQVQREPDDPALQGSLALHLARIASLDGDRDRKRERLTDALAILDRLEQANRLPVELATLPALIRRELTSP